MKRLLSSIGLCTFRELCAAILLIVVLIVMVMAIYRGFKNRQEELNTDRPIIRHAEK